MKDKKINLERILLGLSPPYNGKNARVINLEELKSKIEKFKINYDCITIHSAGSVGEDLRRQEYALEIINYRPLNELNPILFLDGYECKNKDGTSKTLEEIFNNDKRLRGRERDFFPYYNRTKIAFAHNTPANTRELVLLVKENPEIKKILVVTSDYHAPRVSQITNYYFNSSDLKEIKVDVFGIPFSKNYKILLKEFFARWLTWAIFKNLSTQDPIKLTEEYDKKIYDIRDGQKIKKSYFKQLFILLENLF